MNFDLEKRTAALGVGEFSGFVLGPRDAGEGGGAGIWRAQLGTQWHNELRSRASAQYGSNADFELPITGRIAHRGWTLTLTGRIDQLIRPQDSVLAVESATSGTIDSSHGRAQRTRLPQPLNVIREIKTVTRPLPSEDSELRRDYPEYFIQLATYVSLGRLGLLRSSPSDEGHELTDLGTAGAIRGELVFVEMASGLVRTVVFTPGDDALFRSQLDRIADFLDLRLRARERLRGLRYRSAFEQPRPGQETTLHELTTTFERRPLVLFEAPTGFGKTGVLLEFALGQLKSGHFDRALYLTSKSTGQLQVVRTLSGMTAAPRTAENFPLKHRAPDPAVPDRATVRPPSATTVPATPVAAWHVRNKAEHCINTTFHCVRDNCSYLAGAAERWPASGLARFYLDERQARDLDALRDAGRDARICPYEITRSALAFNDLWIGDYNYVFAPRNRGLFYEQPGFDAARTLLLIDEAHNLPSRVADAYSHAHTAADAYAVRNELHRVRPLAVLVTAWDHWCHFLHHLLPTESLSAGAEDDARHLLGEIAKIVSVTALDYAALGPNAADGLWQIPSLLDELSRSELPRLWWCPRDAELAITCLDASTAIGATLREFGGVVLASATLTPVDGFASACGFDQAELRAPLAENRKAPSAAESGTGSLGSSGGISTPERLGKLNKRATQKLYRQLTSAAELLRVEEARDAANPALLRAHAPWREGTYNVGFDVRVDTTFQHRSHHYPETATTVVALQKAARGPVAVFFPSYAYAESIREELAKSTREFQVAVQPKVRNLAAQTTWVDESVVAADALFLVLGSSFAESIDTLGGRITYAMVVGPALPEVNAVQRARLAEAARGGLSRDAAFRQVYQIPGMTKVNQALGRLVRAPGQHAQVLLHCRRFLEPSYLELLAPEYRDGTPLSDDTALIAWLAR